jgi:hypothetical protein
MSEGFSVVQVEVKNETGTTLLYVKCIEGLKVVGQPDIIEFTDKPWEADRPVLTHDLWERVYAELCNEEQTQTYRRLRGYEGCDKPRQTIQVNRVDVTVDGWIVTTHISKRSSTLVVQSLPENKNKIISLNF